MKKYYDENINECMPIIIEEFVKYYGEEYREIIETRLKGLTIYIYTKTDDFGLEISEATAKIITPLLEDFITKLNIKPTKEVLEAFGGSVSRLSAMPINGIYAFINNGEEKLSEIHKYDFEKIIKAMGLEPTNEEIEALISVLKKNKQYFNEFALKTNSATNEQTKALTDAYQAVKASQNRFDEVAKIEFLTKYEYLLSKNDREKLEQMKNGMSLSLLGFETKWLVSTLVHLETQIDSFNTDNELIVSSGIPNYTAGNLKRERIEYFKSHGINLGDNYEDYVN